MRCSDRAAAELAARQAIRDHERWLDLDRRFGTTPNSPLHHNNRCRLCRDVLTLEEVEDASDPFECHQHRHP